MLIGIAAFLLGLIVLALLASASLLHICRPNQILVFSGRKHRLPDGSERGFRVLFGGRGWRMPVIERVSSMSLTTLEVPVVIRAAYSKGGIPLNVEAIANVKLSNDEKIIGNAIERFLGADLESIRRVAKETLEGHLRGVLASLTPEEVNEDRLKFADELSHESEQDLMKLGIHLDTLKILHVSDDVLYLDSIGREAIASVVKDAEIAESDAKRAAEQAESEFKAEGQVAGQNAEASAVTLRNDARRITAELEATVSATEERTKASAREARAIAEKQLQESRVTLEELRLSVDEVLPAEADRAAAEIRAKGEAAMTRERGLAAGRSLNALSGAWAEAGPDALAISVIENLERIFAGAAVGASKVRLGEVHVIDPGDGSALRSYVGAYPGMIESIFAAVERTTGIDIVGVVASSATPSSPPGSLPHGAGVAPTAGSAAPTTEVGR